MSSNWTGRLSRKGQIRVQLSARAHNLCMCRPKLPRSGSESACKIYKFFATLQSPFSAHKGQCLQPARAAGKNKMKFISINGRILDYSKYLEEVTLLKKWIDADLSEYFEKLGFERKAGDYYNRKLDLEIQVILKKKHRTVFA